MVGGGLGSAAGHKGVAAQHGVRAPLLGAAIVDQHRGLALFVDGIVYFCVRHAFDLNPIDALREAQRESQKWKICSGFHLMAAPARAPSIARAALAHFHGVDLMHAVEPFYSGPVGNAQKGVESPAGSSCAGSAPAPIIGE